MGFDLSRLERRRVDDISQFFPRDTSRLQLVPRDASAAFIAGVIGAMATSILMTLGARLQWSSFRIELLLGAILTGRIDFTAWLMGFLCHLMSGGIFALAYNAAFRAAKTGGAGAGMALGFLHGVISSFLAHALLSLQPGASSRSGVSGSFQWWVPGNSVFFGSLFLHLVFGAIVGAVCRPKLQTA